MTGVLGELDMIRRYGFRRVAHLIRPGRRYREREAAHVVAAAATKLIDTPIGRGLSLRQAARLPIDLRPDVYIALLSGSIRLPDDELEQLMSDPAPLRREYPQLFS